MPCAILKVNLDHNPPFKIGLPVKFNNHLFPAQIFTQELISTQWYRHIHGYLIYPQSSISTHKLYIPSVIHLTS